MFSSKLIIIDYPYMGSGCGDLPRGLKSFWAKVIFREYGISKNRRDSRTPVKATNKAPSQVLLGLLCFFLVFTRINVGSGVRLRFWKDSWINATLVSNRFPEVQTHENEPILRIKSSPSSWDLTNRKPSPGFELPRTHIRSQGPAVMIYQRISPGIQVTERLLLGFNKHLEDSGDRICILN